MKRFRLNNSSADLTKQEMVDFINDHFFDFDRPTISVREIFHKNDVVFGLWQNSSEPDGVGMCVIKGQNAIRESMASGKGASVRMAALPFETAEDAREAEEVFGDWVN